MKIIHAEQIYVNCGAEKFANYYYGDVDLTSYIAKYGGVISVLPCSSDGNAGINAYLVSNTLRAMNNSPNSGVEVRVVFAK